MTARQTILKLIYPLWMIYTRMVGHLSKILRNRTKSIPQESFYKLSVELNNGSQLKFESLRGKKILLVNTASNCGYTSQYEALQKLFEEKRGQLMIIGFPANDFKQQEQGDDQQIAAFCEMNFGVKFPLAKKTTVI